MAGRFERGNEPTGCVDLGSPTTRLSASEKGRCCLDLVGFYLQ